MTDLLTRITDLARTNPRSKSLVDLHPEVLDRVHVMTVLHNEQPQMYGSYSYLNAITDYECHVWVRKAVLTIANNLKGLPLKIMRGNQVIDSYDLLKLLSDVNDTMSSADLWMWWTVDMLLGGEAPWELVKKARSGYGSPNGGYGEIWPRQPHTLSLIAAPNKQRYYKIAQYKIDDGLGDPYTLAPDELIHFKFYNPGNPWRGIAPISAVRMAIVIDQYAQAWSRLFFRNSARPDYALIAPQGLTPSERDDIEKKLEQKFGGAANAHKPIVLEQGVSDIKILTHPPKDMEWVEQRKMSREEVGAIFGVPDEIMGWGRDTYENFATAERVLWTLTILPLTALRDTHLTEYFRRVGALRPDETIFTDVSGVSALKKDMTALITQASSLFDRGVPWRVINDMLGLGLPEFEGWERGKEI